MRRAGAERRIASTGVEAHPSPCRIPCISSDIGHEWPLPSNPHIGYPVGSRAAEPQLIRWLLFGEQQDPLTVHRAAQRRLVPRAVRGAVPERNRRPGDQAPERSAPASRLVLAAEARPHGSGGLHRCGHCPRDRRGQGTSTDGRKRPAALRPTHLSLRRAAAQGPLLPAGTQTRAILGRYGDRIMRNSSIRSRTGVT